MDERGTAHTERPFDALQPGLGFYAVAFTDIVRSTEHRARWGDARADEHHGEVDALTRQVMEHFRGVVVKSLGDGLLAVFRAPTDAVRAGVELQRRLARRERSMPFALKLRVGITVGEVDVVEGDVHGFAVNEAARLCAACDPGGVLVADVAASLTRRADVEFGELREVPVTPAAPPTPARPVVTALEGAELIPLSDALHFSQRAGRFVGRTGELETLLASWERATRGELQLAVVTGDAGLGKTSLLGALAREVAARRGVVLYGRCDERVAAPYQPLAEALAHFVEHCPPAELATLLAPVAEELAVLVPGLAVRLDLPASSPRRDPDSERWRLLEGVAAALRAISRFEPVLLIVDDLHWAGGSSIDALDHLVRSAAHERILVVLALRPWEPASDPDVGRLLADRHRLGVEVTEVPLAGLERTDVARMVAHWKGDGVDSEQSDELWAITSGNPLYVAQVLRASRDDEVVPRDIPRDVVEIIERQLQRLTPAAHDLLRVAALVGLRFEVQVAVEASASDRATVLDDLDEATQAGVVRPVAGTPLRYEFTHALVRRALESQYSEARRRDAHARVAEALARLGGLDEAERVRRLTFHWSEAAEFGDPARGVETGCHAIEEALRQVALGDAFELLERVEALAVLVPDAVRDAEVAVLRAEAACLAARPTARDDQTRAIAAARATDDPVLLARAALAHSRGYFTTWGQRDLERVEALEAALARCSPEDRATRALLSSRLANELTFGDVAGRRFALADEALVLARDSGDPSVLASVLMHRQYVLGAPEFLQNRRREGLELEALATATRDPLLEMHACRLLCAVHTEEADVGELDRCLARLVELNEEVDLPGARWELSSVRTSRAIFAGELKDAGALVRETLNLGVAAGQPDAFIFAGAQLMHLNYLRGRLPEIIDTFLEATPEEVKSLLGVWVARQLHLAGRAEEARRWWERLQGEGLELQMQVGVNAGLVLASAAYLAATFPSDPSIIENLRQRLVPVADQLFQQLAPDQPGHHFLALLADARGEHDRADAHFAEALALLASAEAPVMIALTQVAWARSLARRGDDERARELARRAREAAVKAGATQIEREAGALLEGET